MFDNEQQQQQKQKEVPNLREAELKQGEDITKLRAGFPGLTEAWHAFHGNEDLSKRHRELVQKYVKEHPDALDPQTNKIRQADAKALTEALGGLAHSSFETRATRDRYLALHDRIVARQVLDKLPAGKQRTEAEAKLAAAHQLETLSTFGPRLIRRTLQTLDRYTVLRSRYSYPGIELNTTLQDTVTKQVAALNSVMRQRMDTDENNTKVRAELDATLNTILRTLPFQAGDLYLNFITRARTRNAALYRLGQAANPALFPRLEGDQMELLFEENSYQLHIGNEMIADLQTLTIPHGQTTFQPAPPQNPPPYFPWQIQNTKQNEEHLKLAIEGISDNFRTHFDRILGVPPRPARNGENVTGLMDMRWRANERQMKLAYQDWLVEFGRPMALQMFQNLALYRGATRWSANEASRLPFRATFGQIPIVGDQIVDFLRPSGPTPVEYRNKIMGPILAVLGLPPGFDFSLEAFNGLTEEQRKTFRERMEGIRTKVNRANEGVTIAIRNFENDLGALRTLQGKYDRRVLVGANVDEAWIKAHPPAPPDANRDRIIADIGNLQSHQGPQILAAHVVLFRLMRSDWHGYTVRMNALADDILENAVIAPLQLEQELKKAQEQMDKEDAETGGWILYLVCAGLAGVATYGTLGTIGRYGGIFQWATTGAVGPAARLGAAGSMLTYGRWNPLAVLNGAARPFNALIPSNSPAINARAQARIDARSSVALLGENRGFQTLLERVRSHAAANIRVAPTDASHFLRSAPPGVARQVATTEGILLNARELAQVHELCQLRIQAGARALGLSALTAEQQAALILAHYTDGNVAKLAILTRGGAFTRTQALILVDAEVALAGFPRAVASVGGSAGNVGVLGTLWEGSAGLRRAGGVAVRIVGGAIAIYEGIQLVRQLDVIAERKAAREAIRQQLTKMFANGWRYEERGGKKYYVQQAGSPGNAHDGIALDVTPLLDMSDQAVDHAIMQAIVHGGRTVGGAALTLPFVVTEIVGSVVLLATEIFNIVTREQRQRDVQMFLRNMPSELLPLVSLEHVAGFGGTHEMYEFIREAQGIWVLPRETAEEGRARMLDVIIFSAVSKHFSEVSPLPLDVVYNNPRYAAGTFMQLMSSQRGSIRPMYLDHFRRVSAVEVETERKSNPQLINAPEDEIKSIIAARNTARSCVRVTMMMEYLQVQHQLTWHARLQPPNQPTDQDRRAADSAGMLFTPAQAAELEARRTLLGAQFFAEGRTIVEAFNLNLATWREGRDSPTEGLQTAFKRMHERRLSDPAWGRYLSNMYQGQAIAPIIHAVSSGREMTNRFLPVITATEFQAEFHARMALEREGLTVLFIENAHERVVNGLTVYTIVHNGYPDVDFAFINTQWCMNIGPQGQWEPVRDTFIHLGANEKIRAQQQDAMNRRLEALRFSPAARRVAGDLLTAQQLVTRNPSTHNSISNSSYEKITRDGVRDVVDQHSGGELDPRLQNLLFEDGEYDVPPDVYVYMPGMNGGRDWVHTEPYTSVIVKMTDSITPPARTKAPDCIQIRHARTGQDYETIVVTGIFGYETTGGGRAHNYTQVVARRRITETPPGGFHIGTVMNLPLGLGNSPDNWKQWTAENERQLDARTKLLRDRTLKQEREELEKAGKELGFLGRVFVARYSTSPVRIDRAPGTGGTYSMRDGNDVLIVQLNSNGTVGHFRRIPGLATGVDVPMEQYWKKLQERYRQEWMKQHDETLNKAGNPKDLRDYFEKEAVAQAEKRIKQERTKWEAIPPGQNVSAGRMEAVNKFRGDLQNMGITEDNILALPPPQGDTSADAFIRQVLNTQSPDPLAEYIDNLFDVGLTQPGGPLSARIANFAGLGREDVRTALLSLYTRQCSERAQRNQKIDVAGQQSRKLAPGSLSGDTVEQRLLFQQAISDFLSSRTDFRFERTDSMQRFTEDVDVRVPITNFNPGVTSQ